MQRLGGKGRGTTHHGEGATTDGQEPFVIWSTFICEVTFP